MLDVASWAENWTNDMLILPGFYAPSLRAIWRGELRVAWLLLGLISNIVRVLLLQQLVQQLHDRLCVVFGSFGDR